MRTKLSKYHNNPKLVAPYFIDVKKLKNANENVQTTIYDMLSYVLPCILDKESCASDINLTQLEGGLSNHLLLVTLPTLLINDPEMRKTPVSQFFLIRISAKPFESVVDGRTLNDQYKEMVISCHLAEHDIGPQCYGRFLNGRIEEYYPNMRTLDCKELSSPKFFFQIAKHMAKFHLTQVSYVSTADTFNGLNGEIWSRVDEWINELKEIGTFSGQEMQLLQIICDEWIWVRTSIEKQIKIDHQDNDVLEVSKWIINARLFCSETVFCHMDLQSLNILTPSNDFLDSESPLIRLIDFEYSGFNARAVDIANTFCECCDMNNLNAMYEDQYPTDEMQKIFFREYIQVYNYELNQKLDDNNAWNDFLMTMISEVGKYSIVSHIGWAAWSLLQSVKSTIDFDYLAYTKIRLDGYQYSRLRFWDSP